MKNVYEVIKSLQVTEKGTRLAALNQYLFKVDPAANKPEIRQAVETLFKVHVVDVRTMNYAGKFRRGRSQAYGQRADWKRAIVTLKAGEKIGVE